MSSKIQLIFRDFFPDEITARIADYQITRIMSWVQFKTENDWSKPENVIIDTGAHSSIIPNTVWRNVDHEILTDLSIKGLVNREECMIPGWIGTLELKFLDARNNETAPFKIHALFASIDEIPLLIGLKDLLDSMEINLNKRAGEAYLKDLRNRQ